MTDDLPDHTNYSLIKAVDESGNLVTVLADSSGRIVSVMKGDYAGSMKTLAVDEKGRIQAVLTDPEDVFGNPNYIGAGELAARLGSIKSFEHRGNVVFMDDFESSTLKWAVGGFGTGHSEVRSNASARSGNYSLKLTTGDAADDWASIVHPQFVPALKRIGTEFSFALGSDIKYVVLTVEFYDGTNYSYARLRYDYPNKKLELIDEGSVWQTIASGLTLYPDDQLYNSLKMVIDFNTKKYHRAYLNDQEYDISAHAMWSAASAFGPYMQIDITAYNNASGNHYVYIDDVIITQNEP